MSTEKFTQLPVVGSATASDIICAVQAGTSVQETLAQVLALSLSQTILTYAGNPNGQVAGVTYQLLWDSTDSVLWVCTTSGTTSSAVWTKASVNGVATPAQGGTGVSNPTAHGVAIAEGSSDFNFITLSNGQLLIGSTGADPAPATLTAGANVSITNGAGSITIAASSPTPIVWTTVSGTTQAMTTNNGYISTNVSLTTFTLPTTSSVGDIVQIMGGPSSGGWNITYTTNQQIVIGQASSTVTSGNIASTQPTDSIYLVCTAANLIWQNAMGIQGNITVS
jgi:hypothetical protein